MRALSLSETLYFCLSRSGADSLIVVLFIQLSRNFDANISLCRLVSSTEILKLVSDIVSLK